MARTLDPSDIGIVVQPVETGGCQKSIKELSHAGIHLQETVANSGCKVSEVEALEGVGGRLVQFDDIKKQLIDAGSVELIGGADRNVRRCRPAACLDLDAEPADLEILRRTERPAPGVQSFSGGEAVQQMSLNEQQFASKAFLFFKVQSVVCSAAKKMVPSPSSCERDRFFFADT